MRQYFAAHGYLRRRSSEAMEFLTSLLPLAIGSVDRLDEIPDRVGFLFAFNAALAVARPDVSEVLREPGARDVVGALAEELRDAGRLDRDGFRAAATRVKQRTGQKGRALFHPIRIALTGQAAGPELDLAVPAIDRGAELPASIGLAPILGCRERAAAFAVAVGN